MELVKKVLGIVLGAGHGYLGTVIRTAAAAGGGWLVSKGLIDAEAAASFGDHVVGLGLILLAAVGSALNNEAKKDGESN